MYSCHRVARPAWYMFAIMDLMDQLDEWVQCYVLHMLAYSLLFTLHNNMDVSTRHRVSVVIVIGIVSLLHQPTASPVLYFTYASTTAIVLFALNPMDPRRKLARYCVH
jgi:hypothetical protein